MLTSSSFAHRYSLMNDADVCKMIFAEAKQHGAELDYIIQNKLRHIGATQ